jgi:hypothetical protein
MTRMFMVAALTVALSVLAVSQTQDKQAALGQTERELAALSQKALDECGGREIVVIDDATYNAPTGVLDRAAVAGAYDTVELADTKARVDGNVAVVTGRVVFKGGLPGWQTKEHSSGVTIRFRRQKGQWEFVSLCLGKCAAA